MSGINNRFWTDRFYLREFEERDWPAVHRYARQELVSRYQPWGPNTEEESRNYVQQILEGAAKADRTQFAFAVIWRESGQLIGAGELSLQNAASRVGEIGYILHPDYWGQGVATGVAELLISFGFDDLKLHRIFATCDPNNAGSRKVLEKAGMVWEGTLRENIRIKNGWRDSMVYSMLEQEW
ncbi:GNAT family N-acetyltransferase [Planococcus shenhongbingii]|uniref:GNAT family protein n=1 Tax=Planococcus shenhongbingii TaxID=3058398 RepID=A0ABT8NCB1_9BACL|nr:GNAT family protein [Planococcus sp. N017]MDN7245344.1 GNAT family protein [Planococcus sp. N017]